MDVFYFQAWKYKDLNFDETEYIIIYSLYLSLGGCDALAYGWRLYEDQKEIPSRNISLDLSLLNE